MRSPHQGVLREELSKIQQAVRTELGIKRPETVEEWRVVLSGRTPEEIERLIKYWAKPIEVK